MESHISREALSGSLEQLPSLWPPVGAPTESFSKIKTPAAASARRIKSVPTISLTQIVARLRKQLRPRHLQHAAFLAVVALAVAGNSLTHAQALTVKLSAAKVGYGAVALDPQATATVVAAVASQSAPLVAQDATQQAKVLSQQTALVTTDTEDLAKRQVVSTAGDASRNISHYTVQGGDTLSGIATNFNITTDTILNANTISNENALTPGQSLVILPVSGLLYTVRAGDTAASLAQTYQANAAQIISYNDAEVKGLVPGAQIIIPDGVKAQPVVQATALVAAVKQTLASYAPALTHYAFSGNGYAYGYCTWYVASQRAVPSYWGNAIDWYYNARASGFSTGSVPEAGAIAWTGAGSYLGHVAIVDSASNGLVTISEMNGPAGWDRVDTRTVPASSFLYIY